LSSDRRYSLLKHNHDDVYYTETEVDALLTGYAQLSGDTFTGTVIFSGTASTYPAYFSRATYSGLTVTTSDAGSDAKNLSLFSNSAGGGLYFENDAQSASKAIIIASRSGYSVTAMSYGNSADSPLHTFYGSQLKLHYTSGSEPAITTYRPSNGAGVGVGLLLFNGNNAGNFEYNYAGVQGVIQDATTSSEDGELWLRVKRNNAWSIPVKVGPNQVQLGDAANTHDIVALPYASGHGFQLQGASYPGMMWYNTGNGSDLKRWRCYVEDSTGNFAFTTLDDAITAEVRAFHITRSGSTPLEFVFNSTIRALASTTSYSSFRIPHGSAPSSPVDGDIWTTTAGLYVRINGATVGPLA
jgi:hypothetical protein